MNHALIESATGRVVDLFAGQVSELYEPPAGHVLVDTDQARIDDFYDAAAGTFAPAVPPPFTGQDLAALKRTLAARVDAEAERLRLRLITPGSGQAMEYQEAYAEAIQVEAWGKANPGQPVDGALYPMLSASVGCNRDPANGRPTVDVAGEARASLAAYDAYQRPGAAIRGARLRGKAAIAATTTQDAAEAAHLAIDWPAFD